MSSHLPPRTTAEANRRAAEREIRQREEERRLERIMDRPVIITPADAQVITATVRGYIDLVDRLAEAVDTTRLTADVRERLERILLTIAEQRS